MLALKVKTIRSLHQAKVKKQLPRMKLGKPLNTEVFIWIGFSGLADGGRYLADILHHFW